MKVEQFETEFPSFYVEFGYHASGQLPDSLNVKNLLSVELTTELDKLNNLAAVVHEHADTWEYFVILSWRSLNLGKFPCTLSEYDHEIIPSAAIAAAQKYQPPPSLLD